MGESWYFCSVSPLSENASGFDKSPSPRAMGGLKRFSYGIRWYLAVTAYRNLILENLTDTDLSFKAADVF